MMVLKRTDDEINEQRNRASEGVDQGSKWPGMSYEEGVQAALDWVVGDSDSPPMEE